MLRKDPFTGAPHAVLDYTLRWSIAHVEMEHHMLYQTTLSDGAPHAVVDHTLKLSIAHVETQTWSITC